MYVSRLKTSRSLQEIMIEVGMCRWDSMYCLVCGNNGNNEDNKEKESKDLLNTALIAIVKYL